MNHLGSFDRPIHALVVGSTGAIGRALTIHLLDAPNVGHVISWSRKELKLKHTKLTSWAVDITDEPSIAAAVAGTSALNLIIVATGLLHDGASLQPEKTWRSLNAAALMRSFAVNAIGPALVAKHTLPLFPREDRAIFAALSARVGSISDNRLGGWYGYRASKAALNQLIRTLSIELARKRKQAICVGLHPGTVDSELSRPFQGAVADGQLSTPDLAAWRLLSVIDQLKPGDSGRLIAWDGTTVAA